MHGSLVPPGSIKGLELMSATRLLLLSIALQYARFLLQLHVRRCCAGSPHTSSEPWSSPHAEASTTMQSGPSRATELQPDSARASRAVCTQTETPPLTKDEWKQCLDDEELWYKKLPNHSRCNKAPLRHLNPLAGRTEQVKRVMMSKIISCVKISKGPGNTTGSHYHSVTIDLVNLHTAKAIFYELPRTGPWKRGEKICYNWEAKAEHMAALARLLSFEDHRLSLSKGEGNAIARSSGNVICEVIPPFLVEQQEDKYDTQRLLISFYTTELNSRGVITWPPGPGIYQNPQDYATVEQHLWSTVYKMWRDLPQGELKAQAGITWHTLNWRFKRLAARVRRAGVEISDEESCTPTDSEEDEPLLPPPAQRMRVE